MMPGQIHRCNVYVEADDYTSPIITNLKVRFTHNSLNTQLQALPQRERGVLLAGRRLQYPADFVMPDDARVAWLDDPTAGGATTFWNVQEGTGGTWHGPNGRPVVNTVQIEKTSNVA